MREVLDVDLHLAAPSPQIWLNHDQGQEGRQGARVRASRTRPSCRLQGNAVQEHQLFAAGPRGVPGTASSGACQHHKASRTGHAQRASLAGAASRHPPTTTQRSRNKAASASATASLAVPAACSSSERASIDQASSWAGIRLCRSIAAPSASATGLACARHAPCQPAHPATTAAGSRPSSARDDLRDTIELGRERGERREIAAHARGCQQRCKIAIGLARPRRIAHRVRDRRCRRCRVLIASIEVCRRDHHKGYRNGQDRLMRAKAAHALPRRAPWPRRRRPQPSTICRSGQTLKCTKPHMAAPAAAPDHSSTLRIGGI